MNKISLVGVKGRGKDSGGSTYADVYIKDPSRVYVDKTIQTLDIVDLLCEGPIESFVDKNGKNSKNALENLKSIYLNDTPVISDFETVGNLMTLEGFSSFELPIYNYGQYTYEFKAGEEDQEPISGYAQPINEKVIEKRLLGPFEYGGNARIGNGNFDIRTAEDEDGIIYTNYFATWQSKLPKEEDGINYTHIVTNNNINKVQPIVRITSLGDVLDRTYENDPQQGDFGKPQPTALDIRIEVGFEGEDPVESFDFDLEGIVFDPLIEELDEITLPKHETKKRFVRFKKLQHETESILVSRNVEAFSIKEFFEPTFKYPFSTLIASTFDARSYDNPPDRSYEMRLKKIKIPSNYFPLENGSDRRFIENKEEFSYEKQLYVFKENQFWSINEEIEFNKADVSFSFKVKPGSFSSSNGVKNYFFDKRGDKKIDTKKAEAEANQLTKIFSCYDENGDFNFLCGNDENDQVLIDIDISSYSVGTVFDVSGQVEGTQCVFGVSVSGDQVDSKTGNLSIRKNISFEHGLFVGINSELDFDSNKISENSIISNFTFSKNDERFFLLDGRVDKKTNKLNKIIDLEDNVDCFILEKSDTSISIITDPESKNINFGGAYTTRDKIKLTSNYSETTSEFEHWNFYQYCDYPGITGISALSGAHGRFEVSGDLYAKNWSRFEIDHWNDSDLWRDDLINDSDKRNTQDNGWSITGSALRKVFDFSAAKKINTDTICIANNTIVKYLRKGEVSEDKYDYWRTVYFTDRKPDVDFDNYKLADTYVKYTEISDDPEYNAKRTKSIILDNSLYTETGITTLGKDRLLAGTAFMWGRSHPSIAINPTTDKPAVAFFRITGLGDDEFYATDVFPHLNFYNLPHAHSGAITYMECTGEDPFDLNDWSRIDFPFEDQYGTPQSVRPYTFFNDNVILDHDLHSECCHISLAFDNSGNPGILANGMYGLSYVDRWSSHFDGTSGDLYCNYLKLTGSDFTNIDNWNNRQISGLISFSNRALNFDENNNPIMILNWWTVDIPFFVSGDDFVQDFNSATKLGFLHNIQPQGPPMSTNNVIKINPETKKPAIAFCGGLSEGVGGFTTDRMQTGAFLSYLEFTGIGTPYSTNNIHDPSDFFTFGGFGGPSLGYFDESFLWGPKTGWAVTEFDIDIPMQDQDELNRPGSVDLAFKKEDDFYGKKYKPYITYSNYDDKYNLNSNKFNRTSLMLLSPTGTGYLSNGTDWVNVQNSLETEAKKDEGLDGYPPLYYRGLEEKGYYNRFGWAAAHWAQWALGNHYEYTHIFTMDNTSFKPVFEPTTTDDTDFVMAGKNHDIYRGDWDGEFKTGWSDNPAWIIYDLMTNPVYGAVKSLDQIEDINIFDLYEIGKYCDSVDESGFFVGVNDGVGGLEPRHSCNMLLKGSFNAFEAINRICSSFHGVAFWQNGMINFSHDRPKDITAEFSNSNVFDGIFNYSDVPDYERFSVVEVGFQDKDDNFTDKVEYVENEDLIRLKGIVKHSEPSRGYTSRSSARRFGKYILFSNMLETEIVNFEIGNESLFLRPGDIISIKDELKSFGQTSAKLLAKNEEAKSIILEDIFETGAVLTGSNNLINISIETGQSGIKESLEFVNFLDGKITPELIHDINRPQILPFEITGINDSDGAIEFKLNQNDDNIQYFDLINENSFVNFTITGDKKHLYKVINITQSNENYKVEALQHESGKFELIDSFHDESLSELTFKNIGVIKNEINAPTEPLGFSAQPYQNQLGTSNISGQITGDINGTELKYRISVTDAVGNYSTKIVEKDSENIINGDIITNFQFFNFENDSSFNFEVTSLKNPESSKTIKQTIYTDASHQEEILQIQSIKSFDCISYSWDSANRKVKISTDKPYVNLVVDIEDQFQNKVFLDSNFDTYLKFENEENKIHSNFIKLNIDPNHLTKRINLKEDENIKSFANVEIDYKKPEIIEVELLYEDPIINFKINLNNFSNLKKLFIYNSENQVVEKNTENLVYNGSRSGKSYIFATIKKEDLIKQNGESFFLVVISDGFGKKIESQVCSVQLQEETQSSQQKIKNSKINSEYIVTKTNEVFDLSAGKYLLDLNINSDHECEIDISLYGHQKTKKTSNNLLFYKHMFSVREKGKYALKIVEKNNQPFNLIGKIKRIEV